MQKMGSRRMFAVSYGTHGGWKTPNSMTTLANQLERRVVDSTRMRYPDQVCYPQIPNDVYSIEMAREALQLAEAILERVRGVIPK